ncbi:3-hydroxyacyl-CoA dehydrogenase NAD-binding domain-containing protein [Arthrobacter sp. S39]|uniref:3-hydroxyacyl-CoA dehydrogenase NAD-binding domain-containing protein n=1 Tax=Arthrobacter sp. S39 TaxID=2509720 RepID=UPI001037D389|nr:3-hydroxyacyl-CoA dehydrogenase NAD-binding domain-containing protein [Arthrobacter sp. S39]TAP39110.1 multifunctional fatty acid oxidation complex subunit alpha [Arthrobacter sp. S39]
MPVETSWSGSTAILTLSSPPVNTGDATLRRDLRDALLSAAAVADLSGVVIESSGRHFYAGSDISELDRPIEEPQLTGVIAVIEAMPVPVIASINGLALGGGLELALGCDARIGDTSAVVGFPEVTLGMIPGAGGTVRAGRLIGPAAAIDLVASARRVDAGEAKELGILDQVVEPGMLRDAATECASTMGVKRRIRDLPVPEFDPVALDGVAQRAAGRARPNVLEAIAMVCRGLTLGMDEALAEERAIFNRLRHSREAANLRYLFFAKRTAARDLRTLESGRKIDRVAVAGAGTMGAAVARLFDAYGFSVTVFDLDESALGRVAARSTIVTTNQLGDLADSDLVIDAIFEDMRVKRQFFTDLEPLVSDEAIFASNTSYLDLDQIASVLKRPERFAGFHFFNPAERNPLVEVVRAESSSDGTLRTLGALALKLGKTVIPARVGDGFVANRVYADYRCQVEFLMEDGASPEEIDAAMRDLGLPIGPFAVGDMSGLDIAWARRKRLAATRDPRQRYVTVPDTLCELGRFGKKTGAGWYRYTDGAARGTPDPQVATIIDAARAEKGITPRAITARDIQFRVLGSMLCAAAVLLRAGVAARASDIDVALTEGFGFPRWLGGPIRYLSSFNEEEIVRILKAVFESDPMVFAIAEPALLGDVPEDIRIALDAVRTPDP